MTPEELAQAVEVAVGTGFRDDLLAKGQARSMIWRDGVLPEGSPRFPSTLSYDLYSYGYSLILMALRLREQNGQEQLARKAFEHAGEALEAVVSKGAPDDPERGFHRLLAAASFHLGRYSARAFSLLNVSLNDENLAPMETSLAKLMLRQLDDVDEQTLEWLEDDAQSDEAVTAALRKADETENDVEDGYDTFAGTLDSVLTENYLRAISIFVFALETGEASLYETALDSFREGLAIAAEQHLVPQWWCYRITLSLIDDLWSSSFHAVLPPAVPGDDGESWSELRRLFIALLTDRSRAEIELWPSQTEAAGRIADITDDLVLSLPTSAGKTRIAELCILRCLALGKRAVYVTPLRALSAQTESDLSKTFIPLGYSVTALYGSIGASRFDEDVLRDRDIVVATPEKIDFALRNDPKLFEDVGLVVLDEGHMIGLGDREVRYEVQIQRLLKRADADERRIVCLSAILPDGEQFDDFVSWLRRDKEGGAVSSNWRPTRLRFGDVSWSGDRGQLNLSVGNENPFVPSFLAAFVPPIGRRKAPFPRDQRELVLATAWRLVDQGQTVLIYCPERRSVEPYAEAIIDLHDRGALPSVLTAEDGVLESALAIGCEWFGEGHPILNCLSLGVAIHHGALPTPYRKEVERLLREGVLAITVSSPTLAQGLNLAATALVFSSLHRAGALIPATEFKNVVGRAGRAFIDVEGLVLLPLFDRHEWRRARWQTLIQDAAGREMESGLVLLVAELLSRLNKSLGEPSIEDLTEYVVNNAAAWSFPEVENEDADDGEHALREWERWISNLDTAILSLVGDDEVGANKLANSIDQILGSSLWSRRLQRHEEKTRRLFQMALTSRAHYLWSNSTAAERKAYYLAGVGWSTGHRLDAIAERANELLVQVNGAILAEKEDAAIAAFTELAELAFEISPFDPTPLPGSWRDILSDWLRGTAIADIAGQDPTDTLRFIEDALVYRLPWAIDAIRVRALAHNDAVGDCAFDDLETGLAVPTLETGTLNVSAAILIQAGFSSRTAAIKAVTDTEANFSNTRQLIAWLSSDVVSVMSSLGDWPTPETEKLWGDFVAKQTPAGSDVWTTQNIQESVAWDKGVPEPGEYLRLYPLEDGETGVFSSDFQFVGELDTALPDPLPGVVYARRSHQNENSIELTYYGPQELDVA